MIAPAFQLRTAQSLTLTPQLRQAIAMLAMTNAELSTAVSEAVADNPLLEEGDAAPVRPEEGWLGPRLDGGFRDGSMGDAFDFDRLEAAAPSLHGHLMGQARATLSGTPLAIAGHLIARIDDAGYLADPLDDAAARLGAPLSEVEAALAAIQGFDPTGVGGRDLAECLSLQLAEAGRLDKPMIRLLEHLPLVGEGALARLRRLCGVDEGGLRALLHALRSCDPKPGHRFGDEPMAVIEPDLFVTRAADGWAIELNAATLPRAVVDRDYHLRVKDRCRGQDGAWLGERLADARWLVRALDQRQRTILKVAAEIVRRQEAFFHHGVSRLRPLTLAQVADAVGVHETTVSRATRGKHLRCARGTFELKWFFSGGLAASDGGDYASAAAVKAALAELVAAEVPGAVLSDDQLAGRLGERGFALARRTVTKYREALGIGSSVERRRRFRLDG